ncbi:hypothetical protein BDK51DRAFT_33954 [Blyttiomyces helicus]|uniref:Uncharacterized protein n=1 Tax=Blyttiomyces helicus TaxID=388810 RepID=A0A4P9W0T3_9FUNG|nr:hypothetical protein BDK51DRAFT_33954 [Blyttiomyces helicus]|eukprot:RKO85242.1 hypothetical protein BDK51DRAFT_33954 [Blyttiomyces helicus]
MAVIRPIFLVLVVCLLFSTFSSADPAVNNRKNRQKQSAANAAAASPITAATNPAAPAAAASVVAVAIAAATPPNALGLPNGISTIAEFPDSPFCLQTGLTSSNGSQIKTGACASTPLGAIPKVENMVSSLITSPGFGDSVDGAKDTTVTLDILGLDTGFFDRIVTGG